MSRFSRIRTIWRKELIDTLRDRRTLIMMIFVPIVLYPGMMLLSLQGFELQVSRIQSETYKVAVNTDEVRDWLQWVVDTDPARRADIEGLSAEELVELSEQGELPGEEDDTLAQGDGSVTDAAVSDARKSPPKYEIFVFDDPGEINEQVISGRMHIGLVLLGSLPTVDSEGSAQVGLVLDQTDIRSQFAASGLDAVLQRAGDYMLAERLKRVDLKPAFVTPITVQQEAIASPEKVGGSILGQIVPLILIIMTITGAIYPAIDLTAGERERGTLETLMVAPVSTVDLIAGKFVVVALIAMLSAFLNLLSIGGTIYLGGLGNLLSRGSDIVIPLSSLPWVLMVMIPLAVMFSAILLAVCSFARSFKEAQNYVMPVMVGAMIPAVIGILPGTRLEGPLLIMPVTNIVLLSRDLFTGRFDANAILWVMLSTTLYAGAAVAVAAKLFGQEAVLFSDSGSIKTIFQRKFFKPKSLPTAAQAFFLVAFVFSANFFVQRSLLTTPGVAGTIWFWWGVAAILVVLFALLPMGAARYLRIRVRTAFGLARPRPLVMMAAVCFGLSTWVLGQAWFGFQSSWLPMPPEMEQAYAQMEAMLGDINVWAMVFFLALVPAVCEELFFRGYALNGLRGSLGRWGAILVVAVAFGANHHSIHRIIMTTGLGVLLGLLAIQGRSIWPALLAHLMHNGLNVLCSHEDALQPLLQRLGYIVTDGQPPLPWLAGALALTACGVILCLLTPKREHALENQPPIQQYDVIGTTGMP